MRYFQSKKGEAIPNALNEYKTHNVELNVLASFTYFLPVEITDAPIHKSICYHPSLLPLYRGGNALQWQIIDGAPETGVSIFVPDTGVDTGPIVNQKGGVTIGATDTTGSLFFNKLAPLGVQAILEAVSSIESKTVTYKTQDQSQATFQGLVKDGHKYGNGVSWKLIHLKGNFLPLLAKPKKALAAVQVAEKRIIEWNTYSFSNRLY